jgi:hypothetical protein
MVRVHFFVAFLVWELEGPNPRGFRSDAYHPSDDGRNRELNGVLRIVQLGDLTIQYILYMSHFHTVAKDRDAVFLVLEKMLSDTIKAKRFGLLERFIHRRKFKFI